MKHTIYVLYSILLTLVRPSLLGRNQSKCHVFVVFGRDNDSQGFEGFVW